MELSPIKAGLRQLRDDIVALYARECSLFGISQRPSAQKRRFRARIRELLLDTALGLTPAELTGLLSELGIAWRKAELSCELGKERLPARTHQSAVSCCGYG